MAWVPTSEREFTIGVRPMRARQVTTSTTEIAHLTIAYLVLSVDIALIAGPLPQIGSRGLLGVANFPAALAVGATAALTGFVAHEMAHKVVAQRYGFWAEFRLSPFGLLISFMTALFGFLFALPGATVVGGIGNEREWTGIRPTTKMPKTDKTIASSTIVATPRRWLAVTSTRISLTSLRMIIGTMTTFKRNDRPIRP